jgi:hypothetical protein
MKNQISPKDLKADWFQSYRFDKKEIAGTLRQVENNIVRFGLTRFVKEVCVMPVPGTRGKRGDTVVEDFYLLVGIAGTPTGQLPDEVKRVAPFQYPSTPCPVSQVIETLEDWKRRTAGKVIYQMPPATASALQEGVEEETPIDQRSEDDILRDTHLYDRLLILLGFRGRGNYRRFAADCVALFGERKDVLPYAVRKRLRLLGHIVESPDGSEWRILPPLFVRISGNGEDEEFAEYSLVGSRDAELRRKLDEALAEEGGQLREEPQPLGDGPSAWYVSVSDPTTMRRVAAAVNVGVCEDYACCVALLPDLDGYRQSLPVATIGDLHYFDMRLFDGANAQSVRFEGIEGLYEFWTLPDATNAPKRERFLYYDARRSCWRSGDWYGLRFLSHHFRGVPVCLMYRGTDEGGIELVCPEAARLPERYEQALVIASGKLPFTRLDSRNNRKRVFANTPQTVARTIAEKVGAQWYDQMSPGKR